MSEEVVFYHNPMSRGRMVHWMLEEIGVPYRIELVSFDKGEHKKAAFLAVNPMGKIPTIVHRGTAVTETGAAGIPEPSCHACAADEILEAL